MSVSLSDTRKLLSNKTSVPMYAGVQELLSNKMWLLNDGRGGVVELKLKTIKYAGSKVEAQLTLLYAPARKDTPDFLDVEMSILPSQACQLVRSEPLSRIELNGRREVNNMSTQHFARWELCYNHKSERYCSWTVAALFDVEDYYETHHILEINVMASRKQSKLKRWLYVDNSYEWAPIHVSVSAIDEREDHDVYMFNNF